MTRPTINLTFSANAPRISDQLLDHGYKAKHYYDVDTWQADADAITRLNERGLLSDANVSIARRILVNLVADGVEPTAAVAEEQPNAD